MDCIRERVGAYLCRTGTTKQQLASELGMSDVTLWSKLSGRSEFRISEAIKLSNILGISVNELVTPIN